MVLAILGVVRNLNYLGEGLTDIDLGSGTNITLRELCAKIEHLTSKRGNIEWGALKYRPNEIFETVADIEPAERILDWKPSISLEEGLKRTISWYERGKIGQNIS